MCIYIFILYLLYIIYHDILNMYDDFVLVYYDITYYIYIIKLKKIKNIYTNEISSLHYVYSFL